MNIYTAHRLVARAIKEEKLTRPDKCDECETPCKPIAHHDDYNKPLDVKWLCKKCHRAIHVLRGKGENHGGGGTTTIRGFTPELHRQLKVKAAEKGITFTAALIEAVENYLSKKETER